MKIIYKVLIFAIIFRLIPVVIGSMGIFPSTGFSGLAYNFDADSDAITILTQIVSPSQKGTGLSLPLIGEISIQFTLTLIMSAVALLAIARAGALPAISAAVTAVLVVPMIVETGYIVLRSTQVEYNSTPLLLIIMAIIIGFVAVGVISLLEMVTHGDVSD